ncbi:hypothetical protein K502DRAFT_322398 [Neoconidiobolus thromboides FSU 785]|nr:hypothetical protein K502DRAFT_322398 [Neoconidiobolus thromboides FSU 785]
MGKAKPKLKAGLQKLKQQQSIQQKLEKASDAQSSAKKKRLMNRNEINVVSLKSKLEGMTESEIGAYRAEKLKHSKIPYNAEDRILLIGEGNFSFANALCEMFHSGENIFATAYDSKDDCIKKYGEETTKNIKNIEDMGGKVFFDIDATCLDRHKKFLFKECQEGLYGDEIYEEFDKQAKKLKINKPSFCFDKIVFNFPHTGAGIKDQDRNILNNQKLLLGFFKSSKTLVHPYHGELHVTVKSGLPYDLWKVTSLAKEGQIWKTKQCFPFNPLLYPGYEHRRTLGFKDGLSKGDNEELVDKFPNTYIFGFLNPNSKERGIVEQRLNPPKARKQYKNR